MNSPTTDLEAGSASLGGDTDRRARGLWAASMLVLLAAVLYSPSLNAWYYLDDFLYFFPQPRQHLWREFLEPHPLLPANFRPLVATCLAAQQLFFGVETWPCHVLLWTMHVLLAAVAWLMCRDIGGNRLQAMLAAAFVTVAQVAVDAVAGVDTISQVGSTLGTAVAAWAMLRATSILREAPKVRSPWYLLALAGLMFALLMKESGAGAVLILVLAVCIPTVRERGVWSLRIDRPLGALLPIVLVFAAYWLWRSAIVSEGVPETGRYALVPRHLLRNLAQILGATFSLASPHRLVLWWHDGHLTIIALALAGSALVLAFAAPALLRNRGATGLLLAFALCSIAPVAMLGQVSELYGYGWLPYLAILFGLGLGAPPPSPARKRTARFRYTLAAAVLISQALSAREKVNLMTANGETARAVFHQVERLVSVAPAGAEVWLIQPPPHGPRYSVFMVHGFGIIWSALDRIPQHAGRSDVRLRIMPEDTRNWPAEIIACTLRDRRLILLPSPGS